MVFELVEHLESFNCEVDVFDPLVVLDNNDKDGRFPNIINEPQQSHYDAIILAVPHRCFLEKGVAELRLLGKVSHVFFDLKSAFALIPMEDFEFGAECAFCFPMVFKSTGQARLNQAFRQRAQSGNVAAIF